MRCSTAASPPSSPLSRKEAAREAPAAASEGAAPAARLALHQQRMATYIYALIEGIEGLMGRVQPTVQPVTLVAGAAAALC